MWESPIDITYGKLQLQLESNVCKAVQQVDIKVDKEELIKALEYDRDQYMKGYLDGEVECLDKIRAEIKTKYDSIPWRNNDYDDGWVEALEWVFDDVLDKYKTESED